MLTGILLGAVAAAHGDTPLGTVRVASGLTRPVHVTAPPGDTARLFIVEQPGRIRILKGASLLPTPFLAIEGIVRDAGSEQGLLCVAFHPDYATNGFFFVNYTREPDGATVVARYTVSANPDAADAASAFPIITIAQPFGNHNGGQLAFGPNDGYLYIGMGDGGDANDPGGRAQSDTTLLGKMLRIDVDGGSPYAIPAGNPGGTWLPEVWAKGLRNPWRFSFDRATADLYIGDVGQGQREEIDLEPPGNGGRNYGWRCMEGNRCTGLSGCTCLDPSLTLPIHEYTHSTGCSVTGGFVYRGKVYDLQGTYFFADYCTASIWTFRVVGGAVTDFRNRTVELAPGGGLSISLISSFGEDADGELYICDLGGEVFKIVPLTPASDFDRDGDTDLVDFQHFQNCFNGPNRPYNADNCEDADFEPDADVDLADFVVFQGCFNGPNRPPKCP